VRGHLPVQLRVQTHLPALAVLLHLLIREPHERRQRQHEAAVVAVEEERTQHERRRHRQGKRYKPPAQAVHKPEATTGLVLETMSNAGVRYVETRARRKNFVKMCKVSMPEMSSRQQVPRSRTLSRLSMGEE